MILAGDGGIQDWIARQLGLAATCARRGLSTINPGTNAA
jgi:hypothetical protein